MTTMPSKWIASKGTGVWEWKWRHAHMVRRRCRAHGRFPCNGIYIHTNILLRISKHWNSIALLHAFCFLSVLVPRPSLVRETALWRSPALAGWGGFGGSFTQTEELHPHWSLYIDPLLHLSAFTPVLYILCSDGLVRALETLLAGSAYLSDRVGLKTKTLTVLT